MSAVEERRVGPIAYTVRGEGPPVLWISGFVVPARAFDAVTDELADGYTVVAPDHRGTGASSAPWFPTTTGSMASDAVSVLDHLGIDSAHIIGFSLGGMVAQELAIHWPHRVRSLVLGCTTAGGNGAKSPSVGELLAELRNEAKRIPEKVEVGVLGAVRQGWAAATHDTAGRLRHIQSPTLVMHGDADALVPKPNAEWLAAHIQGAELKIFANAGHLLVLESAAARRSLGEWLDAHAGIPAPSPRCCTDHAANLLTAPYRWALAQTLPLRRMLRSRS